MNPATRFLAEANLARLSRYLRLLGFDAEISSGSFYQLAARAIRENRVLLTKRKTHPEFAGLRVISLSPDNPLDQLRCLDNETGVLKSAKPFTRCPVCNQILEPVDKARVLGRVPPFIYATHSRFKRCPACGRIYWPGSHVRRFKALFSG